MVVGRSDDAFCDKLRNLHPYFSGPCELHFRILSSHARFFGSSQSSHQTMAQTSPLYPITEGSIRLPWHMQLFWVSSALKRSQKMLKVGGIVKIRGTFSKMGPTVIAKTCSRAYWYIWEGRLASYGISLVWEYWSLTVHYVEGEVVF